MHGNPRFVEAAAKDDERVPGWEAEDRAAYTADEVRKAEQRAKREGGDRFGELTLHDLRTKMRTLPAPRRAALMAQVLGYVGSGR